MFDVFIIPKVFAWRSDAKSERLLNLQQALRSRTAGKSMLMAHTDFAFLEQFCEQGIVLHEGKIVFTGTFDRIDRNRNTNLLHRARMLKDSAAENKWFSAFYQVVLGQDQGPRLGSFIKLFGIRETIDYIKKLIDN